MEGVVLLLVFFGILGAVWVSAILRDRKFARMSIVQPGVQYPNNHHVMGVGYYHATDQRWFPLPWNEYREGRGYYWDGIWHAEPDQRMVPTSVPSPIEVERVNQEWRNADPDRTRHFWETVERQGFGTAVRRSEGS